MNETGTKKLYMVSLGCSKNLVDSEVMLGLLEKDGYRVTQHPENADLLLVNTCGFIGSAVKEAIDEILDLARYKRKDQSKKLVVTGCLVQRYGTELEKELPEVDLFLGTDSFHNIVTQLNGEKPPIPIAHSLEQSPFLMDSSMPRRVSTPPHRAYMKITEGCINRCSYCLIPSIRGRLRSRSIPDLMTEARKLEAAGVKELTLVAQDLLAYGLDLGRQTNLMGLLQQLLAETEIPWIRLLYLHPARVQDYLLLQMAQDSRIVPYLDIPFQHVSDHILKLMNRPYTQNTIKQLMEKIRSLLPGAALRTTMMVGFPGETEEDINELTDFLRNHHFEHLGVFAYANEEGCRAASFSGQVPEEEKERRLRRIMELQAEVSLAALQKYVGRVEQVLVEGLSKESDLLLEGRTRYQAPEIDGCVYIANGVAEPGDLVDVTITEAHTYDLVGELKE
ncbi:MAG: 30S ribosomal protein S12 methylthiotransferase RimO [Deltaproteobacteria bacterium]|jgi:ribosomal protein S12 methylthiotransferase|nr:30S ribosomal protein S12 methylthiotransferase RimO [Deltaproteobacteria bacterium]